jgi:tetratricopeptide (TPR) repeat protein
MFRLLGLHPGKEISVAAAAALADTQSDQATHLLRTLAMCHLVEEAGRGHFWLHDLLRVYASEQALAVDAPEDIERARVCALSWYLHTAADAGRALEPFRPPTTETAVPGYADAFAWCEQELASFPSVVGLALKIGHLDLAESGRQAFRRGLDLLENEGEPTRSAWCHIGIGLAHADMEDVNMARSALERGMVIHRDQNDQHAESVALVHLADLCRGEKHTEDALRYAGRALSLCRSIDDKYGEGLSLYQLGMTYLAANMLDDALRQLEEALSVQQAAHDDKGQADTLWALARAFTARGDNTMARSRLEEAASIFERRGDPAEAAVRASIANLKDGAAQ